MLTPFECYTLYIALKQHFTTESYDYFYYNGKVGVTPASLERRTDAYAFQKLSKRKSPGSFVLANVVAQQPTKPFPYIGFLANDPQAEKVYTEWERRRQSLTRVIASDLEQLNPDFDSNFKTNGSQLPRILKLQLANKISPEMPAVACKLVPGVLPYWNSKKGTNPIFDSLVMRTGKYLPFLEIDEDRIKPLILAHFQTEQT